MDINRGDHRGSEESDDDDQLSLLNPVQRQLMEYRSRQSVKAMTPTAPQAADASGTTYKPPQLYPSTQMPQVQQPAPVPTLLTSSQMPNPYTPVQAEQVSLTEVPIRNVIDLRNRSENMTRLRKGHVLRVEDLQSEIVIDQSLQFKDLAIVELEVNKKLQKKHKAELKNEMIAAPRSSVRDRPPLQQRMEADIGNREEPEGNVADDEAQGPQMRDRLRHDQLIPANQGARPRVVQERVWLCGIVRRRADNTLDICCFKGLAKAFVEMLLLVFVITMILVLYAVLS